MEGNQESSGAIQRLRSAVDALERGGHPRFENEVKVLLQLRQAFHEVLAERLEPTLNNYLKTRPHDALSDKRALAAEAGAVLRRLGLAIRCDRTGKETYLYGDGSNDAIRGRFQLRSVTNPNFDRTRASVRLFPVSLMPATTPAASPEESRSTSRDLLRPSTRFPTARDDRRGR